MWMTFIFAYRRCKKVVTHLCYSYSLSVPLKCAPLYSHSKPTVVLFFRIDVGVVPSVMVGKQILAVSAAFGSSVVAVTAQEKRWTFFGYEVALGDEVKWVNSSATSDDHCNWPAEEIGVDSSENNTSTAANITFANNSETTAALKLCYRFSSGDHPFKLYPAITVNVYELHNVLTAEEGSKHTCVVGYTKVLTLSGFGTAESDEVRWLLQGGVSCSSDQYIAPMASGGDGGNNSAALSSSYQVSFQFTEDIFTAGTGQAGNDSANVTLCYRFGLEKFQSYPTISMSIHHVVGLTSTVGGSSVAVVDVPEDLVFTGYGVSESALAGDHARWLFSGTNCSENFASIYDSADGRVEVSNHEASFAFTVLTSGETLHLCYWFQGEPAMVYASLTISVAYISTIYSPSFGDPDVAVVGYPKKWGFAGGHIQDGDVVRWIYNESADCSDTSSIAQMDEDGKISSGEVLCTFADNVSGRWITPCYRFGLRG